MLKKITAGIVIASSAISFSYGDVAKKLPPEYKFSRPLPISLGMFKGFMTNQSISDFHMSLEKDTGLVFDKGHQWLNPQQPWTRAAYKYLIYPMVMGPFYKALRMTTEAYGKASRIETLGGRALYVGNTYETYAENYWSMLGQNIWKSYKGVISGSVESLDVVPSNQEEFSSRYRSDFVNKPVQANLTTLQAQVKTLRENDAVDANKVALNSDITGIKNDLEEYLTNRGKVLIRAAGYNARMMHTRNIEDTLWYDGGGHLAQLSNHTLNKLAHTIDGIGLFFQRNETGKINSDLGRIEAAYKDMGIDLSWKEMAGYGALAFLGSAEFWGRFLEEIDYISSGDAYVKSPEVTGFRLPNLGFYLTTQGPSYQINTGYRWGQNLFFPVAVEFVFKGPNKMVEVMAGMRKQFVWMGAYIHGEVVANFRNGAFGGKAVVGLKPMDNFFVDAGLRLDHKDTLEGERNIRSLKDGEWSPSFIVTVGVSL